MTSVLKIKGADGKWHGIPAIRGLSAYEIAVEYGFVGTEAEWNDAVNLNRIAAENAFNGAENAKSRAEVYSEQTYQYYLQAEDSADKAEDANNKAESAAQSAANDADDALRYRNESETQKEQAREYALASDESATSSQTFAEEAKASADKAEQYATQLAPAYAYVDIRGGIENWETENITDNNGNVIGSRYGQTVNVNNAVITPNSKVDLQITSEQMVVFYEKSLAFVAENDDGVVTIYCVGSVPTNDYRVQAIVTEVAVNG